MHVGKLWRPTVLCGVAIGLAFAPARLAATVANDLCAAGANPCVVSTAIAVTPGSIIDVGARELRLAATGDLNVASGAMTIRAGSLVVLNGGRLRGLGSGSLPGGMVTVEAGAISMTGLVDVSGTPPGAVLFTATGLADVNGEIRARASARDESGGTIRIMANTITTSGIFSAPGGTEDALGGDVELGSAGNLSFSGSIDVSGPDGGSVLLEAGVLGGAGNLTLGAAAFINADGENQGGFGGTVDLTASGDGTATGTVELGGEVSADGATSGEDVGGGSGGCVNVTADGQIFGSDTTADLGARGGGPDGDGGEIEILSDKGGYSALAKLDVSATGTEGGGGSVSIDGTLLIELGGDIDATAGDGGDITAASANSSITVLPGAMLDVGGRSGGAGGGICLESAALAQGLPATVLVLGELLAVGGAAAEGGVIELDGLDSVRVVGKVVADGGVGGFGNSVAIRVSRGPALIEGMLSARGNSREGGVVSVDARRIDVSGRIDVRGTGTVDRSSDSMIGLRATGAIGITGVLDASSSPGIGGLIEIRADGAFSLTGTLTSDGGMAPGGQVTVTACDVLVCGLNTIVDECRPFGTTGLIRTNGPSGTNRLVGRESIAVLGNMTAAATGRNELVTRPGQPPPVVLGTVTPTRTLLTDASLVSCVVCGNNATEPPETCDDGNTEDGDGCSASCELETSPTGDVNGDSTVNAEDIRFLITEIFDGDGDSVTMVSGGDFRGTPGADANGDRRIGAGDLPELLAIVGGE